MTQKLKCVAVILLETEPAWLALSRTERGGLIAPLQGILGRYPGVSVRWLDSDMVGHGFTDMVLCEFEDLSEYHFLWEELRDTELFHRPYFKVKDTLLGMEDAYAAFEKKNPVLS